MLGPNELLAAIMESPAAKKAATDHATKVTAERARLAHRRKQIEQEAEASFFKGEADLTAAKANYAAAVTAMREAAAKLNAVSARRALESHTFNLELSQIEGALNETAAPEIAVFIAEMNTELVRARRTPRVVTGAVFRNPNTGKKSFVSGKNVVQPADRMAAVRGAIAAAEALKLEPDQSGISDKLAVLRDSLPNVGAEVGAANA